MSGLGGDDFIDGSFGSDVLSGDAGNDTLIGGGGNDVLIGDLGFDSLEGGIGDDELFGGDGDDFLSGGGGNDLLDGGEGNDEFQIALSTSFQFDPITFETVATLPELTLGAGADQIRLQSVINDGVSFTTVTDFDTSEDFINIQDILDFGLTGFDGSSNPFGSGFLRLVQDGTDTLFQIDQDGSGDNFQTQLKLENTNVEDFTDSSFVFGPDNNLGFSPDGSGIFGEILDGSESSETIDGTEGDDVISGLDGDDTLNGQNGSDAIDGGSGNDV